MYHQLRSIFAAIFACLLFPYMSLAIQPDRDSNSNSSRDSNSNDNSNNNNDNSQTEKKNAPRPKKNTTQKTTTQQEVQQPLDFSDTGRPGQQTAGESRGSCPIQSRPLEAVIPLSSSGKTISGHPNFWVYLPLTTKEASHAEFVIQNEERQDIWRSQFKLDETPGYKKFALPTVEPPLKTGDWHRWYVKLYCDAHTASTQYVQGWVKRVPRNSKLYSELQSPGQANHLIYGSHGIWYDAVDHLMHSYHLDPDSLTLERDWQNLIRAKGVNLESLPAIEASYEAIK